MQAAPLEISAKIALKLEKYAEGVSQADIDAGLVEPIEVIFTDPSELTEAEIEALGLRNLLNKEELKCR